MNQTLASPWASRMLSILRIVVAFLFFAHGMQKIFGYPPADHPMGPMNFATIQGIAALLEFGGGLLMFFGLLTRPVAFILAGEMAVAYFMQHAPHGFWPIVNKGELAVLYCFVFLFFAAAGAGAWSLDALFFGKRTMD